MPNHDRKTSKKEKSTTDARDKDMSSATAVMDRPAQRVRKRSDTTINLRISRRTRDLIDEAAAVIGKSRTEFVVESARQHAIDVLLDQRFFELDSEQYAEFLRILDNPPLPNQKLRELLKTKSPWEK
ncbi:DUF1778 domain-containing protein [Rhodoligotrophos defluvii]|uniref:type II toxin-antitoxin system TacA family antitoxin n=1 Tax=Rhodoligotrophos defluvii TaxID=2561934 RepID=UPI001EF0A35E|nr:DUF1778 domain-containing protein [Rhodoligotrophos defluvii]